MEAAAARSVATGIIGLLQLCAIGFMVIKRVLEADKTLQDIATQFLVEEARYLTFKKQLELHGVPKTDILEALKKRAPEIQHTTILKYLAQISNTFADAKVLHNYGLRLIFNSLDVRILQFLRLQVTSSHLRIRRLKTRLRRNCLWPGLIARERPINFFSHKRLAWNSSFNPSSL